MTLRELRPHQVKALDDIKAADEEWRPVVGYEGLYEVSSFGRVKSVSRRVARSPIGRSSYEVTVSEKIMSTATLREGYPSIVLCRNGEKKTWNLQRIVALAFIGEIPGGMFVCHRDGKKPNCFASNLRIDTPAGNSADMAEHGTLLIGRKNHLSKLDDESVREIRRCAGKLSNAELGKIFNVSRQNIRFIQIRATWRHVL